MKFTSLSCKGSTAGSRPGLAKLCLISTNAHDTTIASDLGSFYLVPETALRCCLEGQDECMNFVHQVGFPASREEERGKKG